MPVGTEQQPCSMVTDVLVHLIVFTLHEDKHEVDLLYRIPLPGKHWENKKVIKSLNTAKEFVKMSPQRSSSTTGLLESLLRKDSSSTEKTLGCRCIISSFQLNLASPTFDPLCFELQLLEYEIGCTL